MKYYYMRSLILVWDIHGKAHMRSRHVSLQRLIAMGIGA
jgi:hypothetical protein